MASGEGFFAAARNINNMQIDETLTQQELDVQVIFMDFSFKIHKMRCVRVSGFGDYLARHSSACLYAAVSLINFECASAGG